MAILKADVRLEGVSFINNKAIGGKGGYSKHSKGPWNGRDYDQYSGGGGGSIFSSGASRTPWGNNANGRNGGIGAGGGGSMAYYSNSTKGGVGGFGGSSTMRHDKCSLREVILSSDLAEHVIRQGPASIIDFIRRQ